MSDTQAKLDRRTRGRRQVVGVGQRTLAGMFLALLGIAGFSGCTPPPAPQDDSLASPPERRQIVYYALFFQRGPNWSDSRTAGSETLSRERADYFRKHSKEGRMIAAGSFVRNPSPDAMEAVGMALLSVRSEEEAKALAELDPAVRAGRLSFRIRAWFGPQGLQVASP